MDIFPPILTRNRVSFQASNALSNNRFAINPKQMYRNVYFQVHKELSALYELKSMMNKEKPKFID